MTSPSSRNGLFQAERCILAACKLTEIEGDSPRGVVPGRELSARLEPSQGFSEGPELSAARAGGFPRRLAGTRPGCSTAPPHCSMLAMLAACTSGRKSMQSSAADVGLHQSSGHADSRLFERPRRLVRSFRTGKAQALTITPSAPTLCNAPGAARLTSVRKLIW